MWGRLRLRRDVAHSAAGFVLAGMLFVVPANKVVSTVAAPQPAVDIASASPIVSPEFVEPPFETFDLDVVLDAAPDRALADSSQRTNLRSDIQSPGVKTALLPPVTLPPLVFAPSEPFIDEAVTLKHGDLVRKWRAVVRDLSAEQRILERCRADAAGCPVAAKRFLAVIDAAKRVEDDMRIAQINRAINLNIRGATDIELYGATEYWATPLKTFAKGAGDCEDYAIAKYVALRELGVPAERLRLVVVRDNKANDYHAVAAVRSGRRWMILDNRTLEIRADVEIAEFDPLYVLDQAGVRQFDALAARHRRPSKPVAISANEATLSANPPQL